MDSINRSRKLNNYDIGTGEIVYWMSRDQRMRDNWALVHAQRIALERKVPLVVVFCLANDFLGASNQIWQFMRSGLMELKQSLASKNINMVILQGDVVENITKYCTEHQIGALVCDFSPLKISRQWKSEIAKKIEVSMIEVDAHNVIAAWVVSRKQEFSAATLRPKYMRQIKDWWEEVPQVIRHPYGQLDSEWNILTRNDETSGEEVAWCKMRHFVDHNIDTYANMRNDPNASGQSELSSHLHFGQISAWRVVKEVLDRIVSGVEGFDKLFLKNGRYVIPQDSYGAYIEQLLIRRELAENFCFYNSNYDLLKGFPAWARGTLEIHRSDRREFVYSLDEFESGQIHDDLWNACQQELLKTAKMHGYMRMYWAKKILEWSESPEGAMSIAITLNDKYELDGRDPNGYAGIAWAIGGVHDRPWFERPVFGTIRYMNRSGCERKFDVQEYIRRWLE